MAPVLGIKHLSVVLKNNVTKFEVADFVDYLLNFDSVRELSYLPVF